MKQGLLGLLLICSSISLFSQTPDYDVEVLTAAYADLDNPTILETEVWDDPRVDIPIPFPFIFLGDTLKEISTDGDIGMTFYSADGQRSLLAYPTDLIDRGAGTMVSQSTISSQLTGSAGNRILKIEWKNAGFYNEFYITGGYSDFVNIQLWLNEVDNAFEVRFGPSKTDQPVRQIHDIGGPTCGYGTINLFDRIINLWTLSGDPTDPQQRFEEIEYYDQYAAIGFLLDHPVDGTVYRYTEASTVSTEEVKPGAYLTVFPTQVSDEIYLKWNQGARVEGAVQLIDVSGKIHHTQLLTDHLSRINCQQLTAGIYFLRWQNNEGLLKTFKFVKM